MLQHEAARTWLDELLIVDAGLGQTRLEWLRRGATASTPEVVLRTLDKLAYLREAGAADWDLSVLNPNRRQLLARLGRKSACTWTRLSISYGSRKRRWPKRTWCTSLRRDASTSTRTAATSSTSPDPTISINCVMGDIVFAWGEVVDVRQLRPLRQPGGA